MTTRARDPQPEPDRDTPPPGWKRWLRPALVLVAIAVLWIVAEKTGLRKNASAEKLHALMQRAGAWGGVAYLGAFVVGALMHVPGTIFLLAARIAYGVIGGGFLAYFGALCAVTASFVFARTLGGRAFAEIRWAPVRRLLARLEDHPVRTIAILRVILWMSPPLNYALAMSTVRFRDYVIGSALGLVAPVVAVMILSDWILSVAARLF